MSVCFALLWATLLHLTERAMAQTTDTLKQGEPVQVTNIEFQAPRTQSGLVIGLYETPVITGARLHIQYFVGSRHCSSIRLHIYLDGKLIRTTSFLGWPSREGLSFGPLDTGLMDLGPLSPGKYVLGLEAEGQLGGCNEGPWSPWGFSGGWAGRLKVITSPLPVKKAYTQRRPPNP